jgi:hypothetical protein
MTVETPVAAQPRLPAEKGSTREALKPALLLLGAAFVLAYLPRLLWGFWTDEAGTWWMASSGWREAIARCRAWTGQSILYGVVESFWVFPGRFQELFLRLPSLAGIGAAAWFTWRIAERFISAGSGVVAVVALVCLPDTIAFGTSARPYALVMAAAAGAGFFLLEWRARGGWGPAAGYAVSAALLVNLHYLAAFLFVPHAVCLASVYLGRRRAPRPDAKLPQATALVLPLAALPLLGHLRDTASGAAAFGGALRPELRHLAIETVPPVLLLAIALGLGMIWLTRRKLPWRVPRLPAPTVLLLALWLLAAPIAFFLAARLTSHSLFAARYLFFCAPAAALVAAWLSSALPDPAARRILACAVFAASVLHPAMLMANFGAAPESWREPIRQARALAPAADAPVLITSGLIESGRLNWRAENPRTSRLFAAVAAYPLANPLYPLPYQFSGDAARHISGRLEQLRGRPLLLIAEQDSPHAEWFRAEARRRGYRVEEHAVNRMSVTLARP